jgi:hypothetical protein
MRINFERKVKQEFYAYWHPTGQVIVVFNPSTCEFWHFDGRGTLNTTGFTDKLYTLEIAYRQFGSIKGKRHVINGYPAFQHLL